MLLSALLLLTASISHAATGAASTWQLTRDEDGTRSYRRIRQDSALLAFKAEGVIDAPVPKVLSVLLDAERVLEWIPRMAESKIVRWLDPPREYVQFTRFSVPWPVRDRFFVSRVRLNVDPITQETEIRYYNDESGEVLPNLIQGTAGGSYYRLIPVDGGQRTRLVGVSVADPNGSVPKWLVNMLAGGWAHETIALLRKQVKKEDVKVLPMIEALYDDGQPSVAP